MRISFMRNIDYWIGIPLSFFLSMWRHVKGAIPVRKTDKNYRPKKILFLELSEMGSAILAYPSIERAKQLFPGAQIYFWIFGRNRESVDILGLVPEENIITMRDEAFHTLIVDAMKNLRRIWREKIDIVIDMELFSRFTAVLTYMSGARIKVGFDSFYQEGLYRGDIYDLKVQYNPHLHISANFMALVQSLNSRGREVPLLKEPLKGFEIKLPVIRSGEQEKEKMRARLRGIKSRLNTDMRLIVLNPMAGQLLPIRSWPMENYLLLAERLLDDADNFIVIIGLDAADKERKMISRVATHERCIDFVGKSSMMDLLHLFSISDLLISHDSGPVHFASLTNVSMIVLFGPETPVCYGPISSNVTVLYSGFACSPCVSAYNHRRSACTDNKCLQSITIDDVYRAANKFKNEKKDVLHKDAGM